MFYGPICNSGRVTPSDMSSQNAAIYAKNQVQLLGLDVERLLMISEALWTILKQHHGYEDDYLNQLVAEIDARDGVLDGRVAPIEALDCPECGAKLQKRRPTCLFCGTPVLKDAFER